MMSTLWKRLFGDGSGPEAKKPRLLLLGVAAVGVLLLLLGGLSGESRAVEEAPVEPPVEEELVRYQSYLEGRVRELCEAVEGVERVTVAVTLESGFESVYATELHDGDEEYVILGSGSSAQALLLTREAPGICGIGIICHGSTSPAVYDELTALVSAAFHTPTNRIRISRGKS